MYYVYLLESQMNSEIYIGSTNNLRRRMQEHNDGTIFSTKRHKPWELIYYEVYRMEKLARQREQRLKHHGNAIKELKKRVGLGGERIELKRKSGAGFTLIEMIIILVIILILMVIAIPRLLNSYIFGGDQTLSDAQNIAQLLGTAQSNAASNRNNDHWGIRIVDNGTTACNSSTTKDCVVIYKGSNYSARDTSYDQVYVLSANNYFSMIKDNDFYFNKVSGLTKDLYGLPGDPVAYYSFENATTSDYSGNSYNGVPYGVSSDVSCARNSSGCMYFNQGEQDYITLPTTMMTSSHIDGVGVSYALWIHTGSVSSAMGLVGQSINPSDDWYYNGGLYVDANQKITAQSCCKDQTGCSGTVCTNSSWGTAIVTDAWYHITGVFDGANNMQYLYIDGSLADSDAINAIATHGSIGLGYVGRSASSTAPAYYDGWIDDVWIFDRALSALDVQGLFYYTRPTSTYKMMPSEIHIANGTATTTIEVFPTGFIRLVRD